MCTTQPQLDEKSPNSIHIVRQGTLYNCLPLSLPCLHATHNSQLIAHSSCSYLNLTVSCSRRTPEFLFLGVFAFLITVYYPNLEA